MLNKMDPQDQIAGDVRPDLETEDVFLVRVGVHGQIGRFQTLEPVLVRRHDRVVCRTARGVEVGQLLGPCRTGITGLASTTEARQPTPAAPYQGVPEQVDNPIEAIDGRLLRRMTPEDELLWGHLQDLGQQTQTACRNWLETQKDPALLLEVEPLLDGKTLYFHFLNPIGQEVQHQVDELVIAYERQVRESKFAQLLENGCGPGCGTSDAKNGCGSQGACGVCRVASKCRSGSA